MPNPRTRRSLVTRDAMDKDAAVGLRVWASDSQPTIANSPTGAVRKHLETLLGERMLLASGGQWPGRLLSTPQRPGQVPRQRIILPPSVCKAEDKRSLRQRGRGLDFDPLCELGQVLNPTEPPPCLHRSNIPASRGGVATELRSPG